MVLLGSPTDWWDPSSFTQGLAAMQWCGLWALPGIQKAVPDDFGVVPWPAFSSSVGKPSTFLGGWTAQVSAKAKNMEAAKAFVKWLWIDNAKDQEDFNLSYGFHIPPRKSLAAKGAPPKASANCGQYVAYRCGSGQAHRTTGSVTNANVIVAIPRCRSAVWMISTAASASPLANAETPEPVVMVMVCTPAKSGWCSRRSMMPASMLLRGGPGWV